MVEEGKKKTHKDLDVWKISMDMVVDVYKITKKYTDDEKYLLVNQLRRAAISIPSNIAEGAARNSTKEFIRFLYIALGSIAELETQFLLSIRLGYMAEDDGIFRKVEHVRAMLLGLIKYLKNKR